MLTVRLVVDHLRKDDLPRGPLESALVWVLHRSLSDDRPLGAAGVLVRATTVDLIRPGPLLEHGVTPMLGSMVFSETEHGAVEAVGWLGRMRRDVVGRPPVGMATAYLEWEDGRWWMWSALLSEDGRRLVEGTHDERSALEGDPMPPGIGRFWTWARRSGRRATLSPAAPVVH